MIIIFATILLLTATTVTSDYNGSFIDRVHSLGTELSQNTIVSGSQVVWTPFGVVNVLPLINKEKYGNLTSEFKKGLEHLEVMEGVNLVRFAIGFTDEVRDDDGLETEIYGFPKNVSFIHEKFTNFTGLAPEFASQIAPTTKNLFLTSLNVIADWETSFHYRNARKSRFFLNETHAIKTKYLKNIGYYLYADLPDLDATAIALKLKNNEDVSFIVIRPNSRSGLHGVSSKLGQANMTQLWTRFRLERVQLSLAKVEIDNQLVFTLDPTTQIVNYGSIRFGYSGIESHFSRNTKPPKFTRSKKRAGDIDFRTDRPFIFLVYDADTTGILNYGEVLMPQYFKPETTPIAPKSLLSSNAKILSDSVNSLGLQLYQAMRGRGSFTTSPLTLSTLLGSYAKGASGSTRESILGNLNFPQNWRNATVELVRSANPGLNVTVVNSTKILVRSNREVDPEFEEDLKEFGTELEKISFRRRDFTISHLVKNFSTIGGFEYKIEGNVKARKVYESHFFLNERDMVNATFLEYIGRVKFVSVPFWDAKLFELPIGVGKQTLLVLSPDEKSGLGGAENGMKDYPITELLCQMRSTFMRIRMPLFTIDTDSDILPELESLKILSPNMTFDRMGEGDFRISKLAQNVQVSIGADLQDVPLDPRLPRKLKGVRKLILNRPFAFFINDENAGIVALGRLHDPNRGGHQIHPEEVRVPRE